MDQLDIFLKAAFYSDTCRLHRVKSTDDLERYSVMEERRFLELARTEYRMLSDDSIRLIHRIYESSWGASGSGRRQNVLMPIVRAADSLLETRGGRVAVRYEKMFHWRELTRFLGEDVFITARLADDNRFSSRDSMDIIPDLGYEPGLRNNDVHLRDMFETENVYDLHTHLNATAKVFDIAWTCLMNHPAGRTAEFRQLAGKQHPDGRDAGAALHTAAGTAAVLRLWLHAVAMRETTSTDRTTLHRLGEFLANPLPSKLSDIDRRIAAIRNPVSDPSAGQFRPDYICPADSTPDDGDFIAYTGEREFLYRCWSHLLRQRDYLMEGAFRYYLLVKSLVRRHMVQLNDNHGFSNFQRYESVKSLFLSRYPGYLRMLSSLAVAGAVRDSGLKGMELRIAPKAPVGTLRKFLRATSKAVDDGISSLDEKEQDIERSYLYHFIKKRDDTRIERGDENALPSSPRNINVRRDVKNQAQAIAHMYTASRQTSYADRLPDIKAIDAASSEFNCRPEVFAQAFRFLKAFGLRATYHAGEDFYDIADGLRAIDEAITYLGLSTGDRLGHALALGIDAEKYYARRSSHVVVKSQWFLDNVVWLYCRARDWNIRIEPETMRWLEKEFRLLFNDIFSPGTADTPLSRIDIETYHLSMLLRGDNPNHYREPEEFSPDLLFPKEDWRRYALTPGRLLDTVRRNREVRRLYLLYHFDRQVRLNGRKVTEFKTCPGYAHLITQMQEALMDRVERHDLCIECCPSSNLVIGSLGRFRNHPIFRFYNVNPNEGRHMAVTVNTDDLGVFHTSLLNEYTYLALALSKEKDGEGHRIHPPHTIATWLRDIAAFSRKYRF